MISNKLKIVFPVVTLVLAPMVLGACGKGGAVAIQSAPLTGANAASLTKPVFNLASLADGLMRGLMGAFLGVRDAYAVSSFTSFKACNDTLIFLDDKGEKIKINGAESASVGRGLLTFSPTSEESMAIGSLDLPGGSISEVDITFAVVPDVCGGAEYAVQFNGYSITQNTAFKFKFSTPKSISGSDSITLMFGQIVDAMVAKGSSLNNETIQTINVGQAM